MKRNIFYLFLFSLIYPFETKAQTEVMPYTPGITSDGITYCLPRTQLQITVTTTATTYTPGDFCQYAMAYLRLPDVIKETKTEWSLDQIKIESIGVPDKEKRFSIKLKKGTSAPLVTLTKDGILLSINQEVEQPKYSKESMEPTTTSDKMNSRDYMTQEILAANTMSKMAELTAEEIYDIRESKTELTKGEADYMPKDGEQLKLMLNRLDTQEKALLQLFKGTHESVVRNYRFTFDPTSRNEKTILFRFSKKLGPVDSDNLAGEPVYLHIKDLQTLPQQINTEDSKFSKKKELNDIRYNVPEKANIQIYYQRQKIYENDFALGQFGYVEHLGEELFNKKMGTHVIFNANTGALEKLEAEQPK